MPNEKEVLDFFARLDLLAKKIKQLKATAMDTENQYLFKQVESYHRLMKHSVVLAKQSRMIVDNVEQEVDDILARMN